MEVLVERPGAREWRALRTVDQQSETIPCKGPTDASRVEQTRARAEALQSLHYPALLPRSAVLEHFRRPAVHQHCWLLLAAKVHCAEPLGEATAASFGWSVIFHRSCFLRAICCSCSKRHMVFAVGLAGYGNHTPARLAMQFAMQLRCS